MLAALRTLWYPRPKCQFWVKPGKAPCEHMFSGLPPRADITLRTRYVRFVPTAEVEIV
jgi:hypothetical protein